MTKRMKAEGILSKRTGAQALAAVAGNSPPRQLPKVMGGPESYRKRAAPEDAPTEPVMYRVTNSQRRALVEEAMRRLQATGKGKLDASEVLREILDEWMAKR